MNISKWYQIIKFKPNIHTGNSSPQTIGYESRIEFQVFAILIRNTRRQ